MSRTDPLFDPWSATYDRPTLQRLTYRPVHDAVLGRLTAAQPSRILDLGCGTGQLTRRLSDRFPDAVTIGLDLSDGMLTEAAHRLGDSASLARANAERLPFADAVFDVVVCTESFHWYGEQRGALADIARCVRPGGQLVIASISTVTDIGDQVLRRVSAAGGRRIQALPPRRLRALLDAAGFDVVHQRRVPRAGPVAWPVLTEARAVA